MSGGPSSLEALVVASGPHVRLRRKVLGDVHDEYAWRMDPETGRYHGMKPFRGGLQAFLSQFEAELSYGSAGREALALETVAGVHAGSVMYYNGDSAGEAAELGISIGAAALRGQGLGREASILFLRYVWANTPYRRIYLHALEWNERAIRCFASAGFETTTRIVRAGEAFLRMEARREWWLLRDAEGEFALERPAG